MQCYSACSCVVNTHRTVSAGPQLAGCCHQVARCAMLARPQLLGINMPGRPWHDGVIIDGDKGTHTALKCGISTAHEGSASSN